MIEAHRLSNKCGISGNCLNESDGRASKKAHTSGQLPANYRRTHYTDYTGWRP
jgi:hypothetical protein